MVDLTRRNIRDIDWLLVFVTIALTLFGCMAIFSTVGVDFLRKQLAALAIGVVVAIVVTLTDYRKVIVAIAPFFYAIVLLLLVLVLFVGVEINNNKAWLRLPGFSFQPSEFAKVATILMLARYMSRPRDGSLSIKDMLMMAFITLPPVILIALENDTGTMLTFGGILGMFYFLAGMRKAVLAGAFVAVAIGLVAIYPHLKQYQQERIRVVWEPEKVDPKGYGYQTIQSMIAVGSGGVLGKGIGQGTQGRLGFLPYAYSDFIGAVVAEEAGLVGVLSMIVLYLVFIWRLISIAAGARDRPGAMMVMGFVGLFTFHIFSNLGMVVGLLPIMGIPLPLMTAGGTAVISVFICVGLALSVRLRRFVN